MHTRPLPTMPSQALGRNVAVPGLTPLCLAPCLQVRVPRAGCNCQPPGMPSTGKGAFGSRTNRSPSYLEQPLQAGPHPLQAPRAAWHKVRWAASQPGEGHLRRPCVPPSALLQLPWGSLPSPDVPWASLGSGGSSRQFLGLLSTCTLQTWMFFLIEFFHIFIQHACPKELPYSRTSLALSLVDIYGAVSAPPGSLPQGATR